MDSIKQIEHHIMQLEEWLNYASIATIDAEFLNITELFSNATTQNAKPTTLLKPSILDKKLNEIKLKITSIGARIHEIAQKILMKDIASRPVAPCADLVINLPLNEQNHIISAILTQNQINISCRVQLANGDTHIDSRLVIDKIEINYANPMQITEHDVIFLFQASKEELIEWATKQDVIISQVNYKDKQIFRTNAYALLMCDVGDTDKARIESEVSNASMFSTSEISQYTKSTRFECMDSILLDENFCYRALKSLKLNLITLEQCATILNYCGAKSFIANSSKTHTLSTQNYNIFKEIPYYYMAFTRKFQKHGFIESLIQPCIVITIPSPFATIHVPDFNTWAMNWFGSNAMLDRPCGGMSHRNRFASAMDRPSRVYLPGVALPPDGIHKKLIECDLSITGHDLEHHIVESVSDHRDEMIKFATFILAETQNEEWYNIVLDRLFLPNQPVCDIILALQSENNQILISEIPFDEKEKLAKAYGKWMSIYGDVFSPKKDPLT